MTLKTRQRLLSKTVDYAENATTSIELPKDNLTRQLLLNFEFTLKTGATAGTGAKNADVLNLVKRIEIKINGNDNVFDLDLKTYFDLLRFEYEAEPFKTTFAIPAANASSTGYVTVPIDFGLIRNLLTDFSSLIPAQLLDSFELLITWGDIDDVITTKQTTTVDTKTKCNVSIVEVYENSPDTSSLNSVINNLQRVYEGVEQTEFDQAYSSYPADELPVDIRPVPARHLSHLILGMSNITDGNPSRTNSVIDKIKLENVKGGGELMFIDKFQYLNQMQKLQLGLESDNEVGEVYLNFVDRRNGGLDNVDVDALKYKFLTAAPTTNKKNAIRIYKKYIPISS